MASIGITTSFNHAERCSTDERNTAPQAIGLQYRSSNLNPCHTLLNLQMEGSLILVARIFIASGLVHNESSSLDLLLLVEAQDTDVTSWVGSLALLNLPEHLVGIPAAKQGELPHGPVPAIIVSGAGVVLPVDETVSVELNARAPSLHKEVVHLLQDLAAGEGGEVGEGLELLVVDRGPHLHGLDTRSI